MMMMKRKKKKMKMIKIMTHIFQMKTIKNYLKISDQLGKKEKEKKILDMNQKKKWKIF